MLLDGGHTSRVAPVNTVTVIRGKVLALHHPVVWDNSEVAGLMITRSVNGGYARVLSDPELGGLSKSGTLDEILQGLHPDIAEAYRKAFTAENPTEENLHAILPGFQVLFQ